MPPAFEGSSFILTYPQSDFDLVAFALHLQSLPAIQYVLVSSEKHEDGSLHRHACVHFSTKQRVGARFFDYLERHPNVKNVGRKKSDWENVTNYVKKDGEFIEWGTSRHTANVWSTIATSGSREEALRILMEEKPRDAILNARNFDYWLDKVFPVQTSSSFVGRPAESFVLPDALSDWLSMSFWYVTLRSFCPPTPPKGG